MPHLNFWPSSATDSIITYFLIIFNIPYIYSKIWCDGYYAIFSSCKAPTPNYFIRSRRLLARKARFHSEDRALLCFSTIDLTRGSASFLFHIFLAWSAPLLSFFFRPSLLLTMQVFVAHDAQSPPAVNFHPPHVSDVIFSFRFFLYVP